jgi:NADPH:quinone reductase-like Zn-dependent oxidoreductase
MMKYKSVVATRRGGPEVLQVVENDLRPPKPGEARVRTLAAQVCAPDIACRYGATPFPPRVPFVPGYAITGVVDALGGPRRPSQETAVIPVIGDQVAALTVYGGYAEYIYLDQKQLIPMPTALDPAQAVTLILNYLVAYQTMHRTAKVKAGDKALIVGASGGIGTAYLQLGRLAELTLYGLASKSKHAILTEYGATPIDYKTEDFVELIRRAEPEGLDIVFDGVGEATFQAGFSLLRHGGRWVGYANPGSYAATFRLLGRVLLYNLLPNGESAAYYGTGASRFNRRPFLEDWAALFKLLEEGKIQPVIMKKYPLLEAAQANVLFESGQVTGNLVLVAPQLL